jgi:hypothetical protein
MVSNVFGAVPGKLESALPAARESMTGQINASTALPGARHADEAAIRSRERAPRRDIDDHPPNITASGIS